MIKEELKQKAEVCMHNALFWLKLPISKENVEKGSSYIFELLEPREKRIAKLEAYNEKLLTNEIEKHNKIVELEAQIDNLKSIGKTSYIKGIRTMANALKEYDRTEGAWTDYFEHKVDETLKMLLKKGVIKENLTTKAECETEELLQEQIEATYKVVEELNKAKKIIGNLYAICKDNHYPNSSVLMEQAEQFLKED